MIRILLAAPLLALTVILGACASGDVAGGEHKPGDVRVYQAQAVIYVGGPSPQVYGRQFVSRVRLARRGNMESYRFENFFSGSLSDTPDSSVILAISGGAAGFGVYDAAGSPLIEYPKGSVNGRSLFFEMTGDRGRHEVRWVVGDEAMSSVVSAYDAAGNLVQSEVTTYTYR
jgi:hypothetical protein